MKKALSLVLALMMLFSLCITPVMAAEPEGSESNPYYVANPMAAPGSITIPANSTVYYQYKAAVFGGWEVGGYGLSAIIVDGVVFDTPDMWGEIYAPLNFTFVSPGIVGYVNDTDEDVEVFINHNEPLGTEKNPAELADGENSFTIPTNVFPFYAVYLPVANGEYTFACAQTEDFDIYVDVDGTSHHLGKDGLTLVLESYIPIVMTIAPMGVTPNVVIDITAPKAGTADNPHWLEADVLYELNGTEPVYFQVDGSLSGNELLIESFNGTDLNILLDGVEYTAKGGALYLPLETDNWIIDLVVSQDADSENTVYFSIRYAEGSDANPIELADGDNAISIPENGYYYYSYTAESDGLLVLTPADVSAFGLLDIYCEDAEGNVYYGYLAEGASSALLPVPAGQTVIISACGVMDEETWINGAVDTVLNVAVKDLLLYNTFEGADGMGDLEGWTSSSDLVLEEAGEESNVANGFYSAEFNATNDWANMYTYVNVEPNTDYEVTLKAMANQNGGLWIKFNDNWAYDVAQADLAITTEWNEYTVKINSGNCTNLVLLLQYAGYAADGQIFWLDDIVITKAEAKEPVPGDNLIVNGSFEDGSYGWETWQSTEICNEAAKQGSLGAHLQGNGGWGGLLNQTVAVQAGKVYKLSFFIHVATVGVNVQVKDGAGKAIEGAGGWFDTKTQNHTVEWTFTATDDKVLINFCGSGTNNPEDVHVDDFVLTEIVVKEPSFDGYIYNGDFETGDLNSWTNLWDGCKYEFVEGYESDNAISITAGNWSQIRQNGIKVEPNTDYVLSAWVKDSNNFGLIIKNGDDSGDITNILPEASAEWTQVTLKFNSGDQTEICVLLIGWEGGGSAIIDNVSIAKDEGGDIPEPPVPPVDEEIIVNGDFETGDNTGWEIWQDTTISGDAAHGGSYGAHLIGNGGWGGMLNQTVTVEAGKTYKLSFWINVNATGVNVQVKDGSGASIEGAGGWFDAKNVDKIVEWVFTATDDTVLINFCGSGASPEDVYVDDFVLAEVIVKEPSFDGYITNGDFETGELDNWINLYDGCKYEFVEGYESDNAISITAGSWSQIRQNGIAVKPNTDYVLTAWVKNSANFGLIVKKGDDSGDIANIIPETSDEWTQVTLQFNSGDQSEICVLLIGWDGGGSAIIDNVSLAESEGPVVPDYTPGDVNGDDKINNKDLGVLKQYLADWAVELNLNACDVNGDGKVNNKDMGLLQQYLNDWDVELQYGAIAE